MTPDPKIEIEPEASDIDATSTDQDAAVVSSAARPIGIPSEDAFDHALPTPDAVAIPWIDPHQHTQSLTWRDREAFDLSGGRATVMIAASYYWSPYRPVTPQDVRFLWDDAVRRARTFTRSHFYDQYVAVGIHTWSRVDDHETLLDVLPAYCDLDEVVAIGETGIESIQHTTRWPLSSQRAAVTGQMRVAREAGLPVILHTPGSSKGALPAHRAARYEEANASFTGPLLDPETTKRDAVEVDLELKDESGLDDDSVIVDHADETIVEYVMESTDCYLAFSVRPALGDVDAETIATVLKAYGPDRLLVNTDLAGVADNDPFTMKRTIMDLLHLGIDPETIRTVVYENPKEVLGIDA